MGFLSVEAINTQILNTREVLTLLREYMRDADSRGDTREVETFMERIKEKKKEYKLGFIFS